MELPAIDTHAVEVLAPPSSVWEALTQWTSGGGSGRNTARFARLLGCEYVEVAGTPGRTGSTFPGFRVAHAEPPRMLALEGGHHFSDYTLDFEITDRGDGHSTLTATTHAGFPGLSGQLYKTLVIRNRVHVLATKRLLRSVARRAEDARLNQ